MPLLPSLLLSMCVTADPPGRVQKKDTFFAIYEMGSFSTLSETTHTCSIHLLICHQRGVAIAYLLSVWGETAANPNPPFSPHGILSNHRPFKKLWQAGCRAGWVAGWLAASKWEDGPTLVTDIHYRPPENVTCLYKNVHSHTRNVHSQFVSKIDLSLNICREDGRDPLVYTRPKHKNTNLNIHISSRTISVAVALPV